MAGPPATACCPVGDVGWFDEHAAINAIAASRPANERLVRARTTLWREVCSGMAVTRHTNPTLVPRSRRAARQGSGGICGAGTAGYRTVRLLLPIEYQFVGFGFGVDGRAVDRQHLAVGG